MSWSPESIKDLRRRMGWSQSDLARRLKLELGHIQDWESGTLLPLETKIQELDSLLREAEVTSEELFQSAIVDQYFEEANVTQIESQQVKRKSLNPDRK